MVRFKEELKIIHELERRLEESESAKERYHLNRELIRRKREYNSAKMYYKKAMERRNGTT